MSVPFVAQCTFVFTLLLPFMAATGGGKTGDENIPNPNVEDLMRQMHLTEGEVVVANFTDDEEEDAPPQVEWVIVGKVLSPTPVHMQTVQSAMRPAWGNPVGLKL